MWTMAPADMPASGPSSSKHGPIQSTVQDSIEVARLPAVFSTPSTSRNTSTLLSAASSSRISGENAECYDQVRDILCGQPLWKLDQEEVLLQPYTYLASRPGKEIRGQMIDAFNVWLQVPEEKIKVIHKVIGMLHTSSLLVDDVEDNSILRRGAPVAHAVFGVPQTINTANYVYFLVFKDLLAMNRDEPSPERQMQVQEMIVEEMINLHRGQGMEIFWRDNLICPTESEYIEMVNNKTSGLLRIVVKLMVANSSKGSQLGKDALVPLVNLIGLLFQIRDDFMNLRSGDYAENKGYCEDLTEGKFSFPIIHSIRASGSTEAKTGQKETVNGIGVSLSNGHCHNDLQQPSLESWSDIADRHHLLSVLQTRPSDAKTKRIVVEYMERRTESFQYTCEVMTRLDRLVREETIAMEQMLGDGRENVRLRGILGALRQGWWTS